MHIRGRPRLSVDQAIGVGHADAVIGLVNILLVEIFPGRVEPLLFGGTQIAIGTGLVNERQCIGLRSVVGGHTFGAEWKDFGLGLPGEVS